MAMEIVNKLSTYHISSSSFSSGEFFLLNYCISMGNLIISI